MSTSHDVSGNCSAGLTPLQLNETLSANLMTTATSTLVCSIISFIGSAYVLIMSGVRCQQRRVKQRRSGHKQRWSEWCAMHATAIVVLNVTVCSFILSIVLIVEESWTLFEDQRHAWQVRNPGVCSLFAFIVQLLQWATVLWNVCISVVYNNVGSRSHRWLFVTVAAAVVYVCNLDPGPALRHESTTVT